MSFSGEVKEELSKQISAARHCQIAEIAVIIQYCGEIQVSKTGELSIKVQTESLPVIRKYFTLLRKAFNIETDIAEAKTHTLTKNITYLSYLDNHMEVMKVLQSVKICDSTKQYVETKQLVHPVLLKSSCCKRAYLRGAYLSIGSMSDPEKSYHFEMVCVNEAQAEQLRDVIRSFDVDAKIVTRKKYFIVYVKEGAGIVELLNIMEAHVSLMSLENMRILKEMRNSINRRVNCEAANITKTVNAASKQIEDILFIRDAIGFKKLQSNLKEMAELRLEYPDASLKELGQYFDPPVGKSGVNHRLRKLSEIAESAR